MFVCRSNCKIFFYLEKLTLDTNGLITTYTYDIHGRLLSKNTGNSIISYTNGEAYRTVINVTKINNGIKTNTITNYLYDADKVILETDKNGIETGRNIYGTTLISRKDGILAYYMYNGHGDVTSLLDGNGNIMASYRYDAFGNTIEQSGTSTNLFKYAGYRADDETGDYYLNARYYDPESARFLTEDTYTGNEQDPLSLNLYSYCHNDPVNAWDPSGHKVYTTKKDNKYEILYTSKRVDFQRNFLNCMPFGWLFLSGIDYMASLDEIDNSRHMNLIKNSAEEFVSTDTLFSKTKITQGISKAASKLVLLNNIREMGVDVFADNTNTMIDSSIYYGYKDIFTSNSRDVTEAAYKKFKDGIIEIIKTGNISFKTESIYVYADRYSYTDYKYTMSAKNEKGKAELAKLVTQIKDYINNNTKK